jgi:hypothetical protein
MEPSAWGYNWATLFLGGYKYGDLALQVGCSTESETVKMVMSPAGLGHENNCAGENQQQL